MDDFDVTWAPVYADALEDLDRATAWIEKQRRNLIDRRDRQIPFHGTRPKHETVPVRLGPVDVPIDRNLAPLIEALRDTGIMTLACCEGPHDDGRAFVTFPTIEYARGFVQHMKDGGFPLHGGPVNPWSEGKNWRWYVWPHKDGRFSTMVDFPLRDAEAMVRHLRRTK